MATSTSDDFASAMEQGLQAQQAGNTEQAFSFFARATELDPNSGQAWFGRAGTAGDPDDALVSLGYATALSPDRTDLPPQLEFMAQMRASVAGSPDAPALVMVGQKLAEVGLTDQAEFLFRRAKELDDKMEDASVWLAAVTKDPAESERLLKKVLAQNPDNPLAQAGLGQAVAPDLARTVDSGVAAQITPPPAAPTPPAQEPAQVQPQPADEPDLPPWLTSVQEPAKTEENAAAPAPADDFASELQRLVSEPTAEAPAEPTQAVVPEDLAAQPWWNELSEPAPEAPAAPAAEAAQEPASSWWTELEKPGDKASELAEQVPEELPDQSWWKAPGATEEQANAEKPAEVQAEAAFETPSETQPVASGEWWKEPAEEVTPAAAGQDAAALAADLLRQGQEALARDDKAAAYSFFVGTLELAPNSEAAWWGRAHSAEDSAERIESLEHVLQLNPDNLPAREALTLSRVRKLRDEGHRIPGARERAEQFSEEKAAPAEAPAEGKRSEPAPLVSEPEPAQPGQPTEPLPPTPVSEEPVAVSLEGAPGEPKLMPAPLPTVSQEEWKLPEKFRSASGGWNLPDAGISHPDVGVPSAEPAAPVLNVTPLILIALALIVLILLVLGALYILKL